MLKLGLMGIIGGNLLASSIMLPIRICTAHSLLSFKFSKQILIKLLAFGLPLVPMGLAYWIFDISDRILLGKLSTIDQVGLYAIASSVSGLLVLINFSIGQAWGPLALSVYAEQREIASIFFGQVMTYLLVGFGLLAVVITTFALEGLMILTIPKFYSAGKAVGPLSLGLMASASTQVTALSISFKKKTKYFAITSWFAALLNLILNFILIPKWGLMAASWSTMISYSFLSTAYMFISQRLWPIAYENSRVFGALALTFGFVLGVQFFPEMKLTIRIIVKIFYCITYFGLLFLFQVIDKREWLRLSSTLRRRLAAA